MKENIFKTFLAGFIGCITYLLGGWDMTLQIFLIVIAVDLMIGTLISLADGTFKPSIFWTGITKKFITLIIVIIAVCLDRLTGANSIFRNATIFFYVAYEITSILKNMGQFGVPVPKFLNTAADTLQQKAENVQNPIVNNPPESKDTNSNNTGSMQP